MSIRTGFLLGRWENSENSCFENLGKLVELLLKRPTELIQYRVLSQGTGTHSHTRTDDLDSSDQTASEWVCQQPIDGLERERERNRKFWEKFSSSIGREKERISQFYKGSTGISFHFGNFLIWKRILQEFIEQNFSSERGSLACTCGSAHPTILMPPRDVALWPAVGSPIEGVSLPILQCTTTSNESWPCV